MERLLKPAILTAQPNSEGGQTIYKHWKKTFQNFLGEAPRSHEEVRSKSLEILQNYVNGEVFQLIDGCGTHDEAIQKLDDFYITKKSELFSRYKLTSRKQQPSESLEQYIQALELLARNCTFESVTSAEYKAEALLSAFILGVASPEICKRILEKDMVVYTEALSIARSIDLAHRNAQSISGAVDSTITTPSHPVTAALQSTCQVCHHSMEETSVMTTPEEVTAAMRRKCFFCGYEYHSRNRCPAKDKKCDKCGKMGHFSQVCKTNGRRNTVSGPSKLSGAMISQSFLQTTLQNDISYEDRYCNLTSDCKNPDVPLP